MTALMSFPPRRTTPTRRAVKAQTRGDRTRQLIIDETIRCVREEGFAAISASHIAERAGVTWGVIQYHFGDRNAVLMAVVDHGYDLLRDAIDDVELPVGSTRERVQAVVDAGWDAFSNPASLAAFEILVATRAGRDTVARRAPGRSRGPAGPPRTCSRSARSGTKAPGNRQPVLGRSARSRLSANGRQRTTRLHARAARTLVDLLTMHLESRGRGDVSPRR